MSKPARLFLFWSPRALGIAFALFISIFALDALSEGGGFWTKALAIVMHLVPTALVVIALVVAWRWEWVGALLFIGLGLFYTLTTLRRPDWILVIGGPLFVVGALFLAAWFKRKELRAPSGASVRPV